MPIKRSTAERSTRKPTRLAVRSTEGPEKAFLGRLTDLVEEAQSDPLYRSVADKLLEAKRDVVNLQKSAGRLR